MGHLLLVGAEIDKYGASNGGISIRFSRTWCLNIKLTKSLGRNQVLFAPPPHRMIFKLDIHVPRIVVRSPTC